MKPVYIEGTAFVNVGSSGMVRVNGKSFENMVFEALEPEEKERYTDIPVEMYVEIVPLKMGLKISSNPPGIEDDEEDGYEEAVEQGA
ncbi:MAG: hypothetical protein ACPLTR_01915 [Thermacetogeniaceae bacterium]